MFGGGLPSSLEGFGQLFRGGQGQSRPPAVQWNRVVSQGNRFFNDRYSVGLNASRSLRDPYVVSGYTNVRPGLSAIENVTNLLRDVPSKVSSGASSARTLVSVPLSTPPTAVNTVGRSVWSRIGAGFGTIRSMVTSVGARALATLGPIGLAIVAAAAAMVVIGGIVYYASGSSLIQASPHDLPQPETPSSPDGDFPLPVEPIEEPVDSYDPWAGNVPWRKRPGFDYTLPQICRISSVLRRCFRLCDSVK
jgi:hypothetical protein